MTDTNDMDIRMRNECVEMKITFSTLDQNPEIFYSMDCVIK